MAKRTRIPGFDRPARKPGGVKKRKKIKGLDVSTPASNRASKGSRTKSSQSPGRGKRKGKATGAARKAQAKRARTTAARRVAKKAAQRARPERTVNKRKRKRF